MAYHFHDSQSGDLLELSSGQLIMKIQKEQAICLQGEDVGLLLNVSFDTNVIRIMDREDLVSVCLDSC